MAVAGGAGVAGGTEGVVPIQDHSVTLHANIVQVPQYEAVSPSRAVEGNADVAAARVVYPMLELVPLRVKNKRLLFGVLQPAGSSLV